LTPVFFCFLWSVRTFFFPFQANLSKPEQSICTGTYRRREGRRGEEEGGGGEREREVVGEREVGGGGEREEVPGQGPFPFFGD
jgi:hypothetical protein